MPPPAAWRLISNLSATRSPALSTPAVYRRTPPEPGGAKLLALSAIPLTLFVDAFFSTPFDFRAYVALAEKGLDFAASRVMVGNQGLTPSYRERSVTARVPGLVHGDFWLAESIAIVEYLEEAFPPPTWPRLYPPTVRARARARQLMLFLATDLRPLTDERPSWMIAYPQRPPPLSPTARDAADELLTLGSRLVAEKTFTPWSIASADLAFALLRLSRTGEALPPELEGLVAENLARPSVRGYLEHDRPPNPPLTGRRVST
jgi:glutathione S-transferase